MTPTVEQRGRLHQEELGENAGTLANEMKACDPDATWQGSAGESSSRYDHC